MDLVNKAYAQLKELFLAMTVQARITTVLLIVAIGVSLFFLFQYQSSPAEAYLFGGRSFSQDELAKMEAAFAQAGLSQSEIEGNKMKVPKNNKDAYLAALADANALPENAASFIEEALQSSPFESQAQREARLKHAKERQVSIVVSQMSGIERAVVTFEKEVRPGFRKDVDIRALAAVKAAGNQDLTDEQVRAIRTTVTAFVAGLKKEGVTITDMNGGRAYAGVGEDGSPIAADAAYAQHKQLYEERWTEKIQNAVSMIPGVIVGVDVVLTKDVNTAESSVEVGTKPITLASESTTKSSTSKNNLEGGRVGSVPNGVAGVSNSSQSVGAAGSESVVEESSEQQQSVAGRTHKHIERAGLVPETVRASIQIPVAYYKQVWMQRNPPKEGEPAAEPPAADLAAIREEVRQQVQAIVVQLLPPVPQDVDRFPLVEVASYVSIPTKPLPEPGMTDEAMGWLAANWHFLAGLGLAAFAVMLLRSFVAGGVKNPAPESDIPQLAQPQEDRDDLSEEAEAAVNVLRGRFESHGPSLRDDLGELVREDPDAAASVLRSWIGEAA